MPTYQVTSPNGQKLQLTGDTPPSEQQLNDIFAQVPSSTPPPNLSANQSGPLMQGESRTPAPVPQPQDTGGFLNKLSNLSSGINEKFLGGILQGGANLVKTVNPAAGQKVSDWLNKNVIKPNANPTPLEAIGQKIGGAEKSVAESVATLATPEIKLAEGASAGAKIAAGISRPLVSAGAGFTVGAADTGDIHQAITSALVSGFTSGISEAASPIKNAGRSAMGKTTIGQVFGNPSKDVTAGLMGRGSSYVQNDSRYMANLEKADKQSPGGVPGEPVISSVSTLFNDGTRSSFGIGNTEQSLKTGGYTPLDFSNSVFKNDTAAQKRISTIWQDVVEVSYKNNPSVSELDTLKQRIGEEVKKTAPAIGQDATREHALMTALYNKIEGIISASSPAYAQAMADYQGYKAGQALSNWIPKSVIGKLGEGSIAFLIPYLHNPALIAALLAGSPKIGGTGTRIVGAINRTGGKDIPIKIPKLGVDTKLPGVVSTAQTTKNVPASLAGLLKALGAIP